MRSVFQSAPANLGTFCNTKHTHTHKCMSFHLNWSKTSSTKIIIVNEMSNIWQFCSQSVLLIFGVCWLLPSWQWPPNLHVYKIIRKTNFLQRYFMLIAIKTGWWGWNIRGKFLDCAAVTNSFSDGKMKGKKSFQLNIYRKLCK